MTPGMRSDLMSSVINGLDACCFFRVINTVVYVGVHSRLIMDRDQGGEYKQFFPSTIKQVLRSGIGLSKGGNVLKKNVPTASFSRKTRLTSSLNNLKLVLLRRVYRVTWITDV